MSDLLSIDRQAFAEAYGSHSFRVSHQLTEHPLLSVESLADLADYLPEDKVEHNRADIIPEIVPSGEVPRLDATPGEIARSIETNGCWMVLKRVELHPDYNGLLDETLDEVLPHVVEVDGEMRHRVGFIFLTSPGGKTPAHTDPEHNFLLQIRGWKEITIGRWPTKEAEQEELETQVGEGGHRNVQGMPEDNETFRLDPGDGVYVPIHAPHMVRNGDTVSVGLSITWLTPRAEDELKVTSLNARLRKAKLSPTLPGAHPLRDKAKANVMRAVHRVRGTGIHSDGEP
jgi:hypothetical protein